MQIGKVIGYVWATKKDETLNGQKLLIVRIISPEGEEKEECLVAADNVGAGAGEWVLIAFGGAARLGLSNSRCPVDAAIVGIIDKAEVEEFYEH